VEKCSAIVLAGGRASRLGGINKARIEVGGVPIIHRIVEALRPLADQTILVGRFASDVGPAGVEVLPDAIERGSALVGLYSGLLAARHDAAIAVACDMPFLSAPLLAHILTRSVDSDVTVPRIGPHLEALHAVYRRSCLPPMLEMIEAGDHKIVNLYDRVRVLEISEAELRSIDPDLLSVFNVNTPSDMQRAQALATSRQSFQAQYREDKLPPVVSVVGRSDSGKTTFLEKLIPELKSRGLRIAVVKHDRHGFEMDRPGKDTWRLRQAGADAVMISAPNQMALIRAGLTEEVPLDDLARLIDGAVDLVLTEGYKSGNKPKIEVSRLAVAGGELLCSRDELLAIVADRHIDMDVPQFDLEDAAGVAELLAGYLRERDGGRDPR
jgi:molybdopterin-guanine dinucleotide biosynthesis protein